MSGVVKVEQIDRDAGMALLGESWITQPVDDVFAQAFARHRIAAAPIWQPIETAPRDGTRILILSPLYGGKVSIARYNDDRYAKKPSPYWDTDSARVDGTVALRKNPPAHWLPLPSAPEVKP